MALLAVLGGCSRYAGNDAEIDIAKPELSIELPANISRTGIDNEGRAIWVKGDSFHLWAENRGGDFDFDGVKFSMLYYTQSYQSVVFTSNATPLTEGTYTYYAVSPSPESTNGRTATYTIPTAQDGSTFNGEYDILVASPVKGKAVVEKSINSGLDIEFNHKMHLLKLVIPKGANKMGYPIRSVVFTFPRAVTGNITVDAKDPSANITVNSGSKELIVNIPNGFDEGNEAWGAILPGAIAGEVSYYAVSTIGQPTAVRTFTLAKECLGGHITPLSLTIPDPIPPTIYFSIGANYLGEAIQKFTVYDNLGTTVVSHSVNSTNSYNLNKNNFFTIDKIASYHGKTFTVQFESANAIVSKQFTMPSNIDGFDNTVIPAVDVPYLFFEDFTSIHTNFEKSDEHSSFSSSNDVAGMLLDSYMSVSGWNGARIKGVAGQCVRVNVRHESTGGATRSNGRLDTPAMKGLKSGANVKLKVEFDMGGYISSGYSSNNSVYCIAGTHTKAEGSAINGLSTRKAFSSPGNDTSRIPSLLGSHCLTTSDLGSSYNIDSFGSSFPTYSFTASGCSSATRIAWFPCTNQNSWIDVTNAHYYLYIDNIRVSIAQ